MIFGIFFNSTIELILNVLLFIFLAHFIYGKISIQKNKINLNKEIKGISLTGITTKTLAFTYLNPHVYSDTVFFLGNFSKNLLIIDDLLATGGTALAAIDLINMFENKNIIGAGFIINLPDLKGDKKLQERGVKIHSLMDF